VYQNEIKLLPFKPENQDKVKALILSGLVEHWGWFDAGLNPDLDDIFKTYAGAVFLVAWLGDQIVGTGALVPRENGTAEIVRMSVEAAHRRRGIGRLILRELVEKAKAIGYTKIRLETTAAWQEVVAFYISFGFRFTDLQDGDAYFELNLEN
jgi:GNAT superfamily N-acetyltransferase